MLLNGLLLKTEGMTDIADLTEPISLGLSEDEVLESIRNILGAKYPTEEVGTYKFEDGGYLELEVYEAEDSGAIIAIYADSHPSEAVVDAISIV